MKGIPGATPGAERGYASREEAIRIFELAKREREFLKLKIRTLEHNCNPQRSGGHASQSVSGLASAWAWF